MEGGAAVSLLTRAEVDAQAWIGNQRAQVEELLDTVDFLKAQVQELLRTRDSDPSVDELALLRAELQDLRDWPCEHCATTLGNVSDADADAEGSSAQHPGFWVCGNCYERGLVSARNEAGRG